MEMFDYIGLYQNKLQLLPYLFLALAIISLWLKRHILIWGTLLVLGIITGIFIGRLNLSAIFSILVLGLAFFFTYNAKALGLRIIAGLFGILCSALIFFHLLPGLNLGFNNYPVVQAIKLTADAIPYTLYFNFDKPLVGLFILAFGWEKINTGKLSKKTLLLTFIISILAIFTLSIISMSLGYLNFDPKWTNFFFLWVFVNLIFTCVAEEALFRGLIQRSLEGALSQFLFTAPVAIGLASILFGLAHYRGGLLYIIISAIAGLFYGSAYYLTRRLEASIATHLLVNTTHFLLFTYPALQPTIQSP